MSTHPTLERDTAETWMRDDLARVCQLFGHSEDASAWVADMFAPVALDILARSVRYEIERPEAEAA